jgi:hypothetical protein
MSESRDLARSESPQNSVLLWTAGLLLIVGVCLISVTAVIDVVTAGTSSGSPQPLASTNAGLILQGAGLLVQVVGFAAAAAGLFLTFLQIRRTYLQNRDTATWDTVTAYQERWNTLAPWSEEKLPWTWAEAKKRFESDNSNADDVINFFESLAFLTQVRGLNLQWVWFVFYDDANFWWSLTKDYIRKTRFSKPSWSDRPQPAIWSYYGPWLKDLQAIENREEANAQHQGSA